VLDPRIACSGTLAMSESLTAVGAPRRHARGSRSSEPWRITSRRPVRSPGGQLTPRRALLPRLAVAADWWRFPAPGRRNIGRAADRVYVIILFCEALAPYALDTAIPIHLRAARSACT